MKNKGRNYCYVINIISMFRVFYNSMVEFGFGEIMGVRFKV